MSSIKQLADEEAARAEAENPDEPETPDTPAEPAPDETEEEEAAEEEETPATPAEEPVSEKQLKARNKSLQLEDQRHEKRLHEIYGSTWGKRNMCPLCLQEGFVIPYEPGTFDPQQREMVEAAMGDLAEPEYRKAKDTRRCEGCDGLRKVESGSRDEATRFVECMDCGGLGYIREAPATNVAQMPPVTWNNPAAAAPPVYAGPNIDNWGRPAGHPDWGRDPSQVNAAGYVGA